MVVAVKAGATFERNVAREQFQTRIVSGGVGIVTYMRSPPTASVFSD